MIDHRLTSKQLDELRAAHREASDIRGAYRIHTVILLGQGWSVAQVADALLIDSETVRRYFKRYRKGGIEELLRMSYVGGEALLDEQQLAELDAHLQTKVYAYLNIVGIFQGLSLFSPGPKPKPRIADALDLFSGLHEN
jgi:hypothetical protein